ncbi:PilZ domain-containing protein [Silvanigrella sp.]|uniref:PilZ domain-containing protein n=1 Tax=Silvanigrella sp. TaxID=2024976 RepID=UPI0037CA08FD
MKKENRKSARHDIEFVVSLYRNGVLLSPNNSFKNISIHGALLNISNNYIFKCGERVVLLIEDERLLKEFNLMLEPIEAEVRHFENENENENLVGLVFINMTDSNKRILQRIIDNKFMLKKFPKSWQISK